jgi:tRNA A-37 threonylcarbamoyl transferase component Bud32
VWVRSHLDLLTPGAARQQQRLRSKPGRAACFLVCCSAMGFFDRWLKRHLDEPEAEPAPPPSARYGRQADEAAQQARPPEGREGQRDALDILLDQARAQLTLDDKGRRYASGPDFLNVLSTLDGSGRSRAADALLADALLVCSDLGLRRRLAERLLHRGDQAGARVLLDELKDHPAHATWAMTCLAELAEAESDEEDALAWYERVLAIDITLAQPKARARRLRARRDEAQLGARRAQSALTRFLGARAAGSRYAVLEEIGRGGAATVFRARDRVIDREVALKIFHPRGKAEERRARLVQEARIAGSFDHPHIVPILDVDAERDLLVMSLCDGGSLRQRMGRGALPLNEAVEIGAVLLQTLDDVHAAGRLHLDVKPSNLLFHEGRMFICDFGTAGLVEMGAGAGTRAYMAPEQRARGLVSPAADLFAAGLLIFESLTGHLPPGVERGHPEMALMELPAGPRRRALEATLRPLVAFNAEDRPASARGVARQLLEASSLPIGDKEGAQLLSHLQMLARREGGIAESRLADHPLAQALTAPA